MLFTTSTKYMLKMILSRHIVNIHKGIMYSYKNYNIFSSFEAFIRDDDIISNVKTMMREQRHMSVYRSFDK